MDWTSRWSGWSFMGIQGVEGPENGNKPSLLCWPTASENRFLCGQIIDSALIPRCSAAWFPFWPGYRG
jgi:hypothetical protein